MGRWCAIVAIAVVAVSIPAHAVSIPAVTLDQRGGTAQGGDDTVGWDFTVATSVEVSALGVFDAGSSDGDGLIEEHHVGLWASDGTLIASVTVTPASIPRELFVYRLLAAPVTLEPGVTYVIGAQYFVHPGPLDFFLGDGINGDTFQYDGRIIPGSGRFRDSGLGFGFPDVTTIRSIGPGLLLVVPEPGAVGLLGLAMMGMLHRRTR